MQEIILTVTATLAVGGLGLASIGAAIFMFKEAWEYSDWSIAVMASIMLFCAGIPCLGILISLLF